MVLGARPRERKDPAFALSNYEQGQDAAAATQRCLIYIALGPTMPGQRRGWGLLPHLEKLALRTLDLTWSGGTDSNCPGSTLSPDSLSLGGHCGEAKMCTARIEDGNCRNPRRGACPLASEELTQLTTGPFPHCPGLS